MMLIIANYMPSQCVARSVICFVQQACRGNNLDAACDAVDAPQFMDVSYGQERKYRVPVEADFLYAYSTTPRTYLCVAQLYI